MPTTIQYLIVPAWSDQAGQCRIVRREHEIQHPDPLQHYRQYPQQWQEAGIMNSRGVVVTLDASPEVLQEFRDCEPLMAGTSLSFPAQEPRPAQSLGAISLVNQVDFMAITPLVAADFALALESEIGVDDLRMVVDRNSAEPSLHVCHSHDFCDANMLMAAAIKNRSGCDPAEEGRLLEERFFRLWNDAWDTAKTTFFGDTSAARQLVAEFGTGPAALAEKNGAETSTPLEDVPAP